VGSSVAAAAEVDTELVVASRFFVDYRESTFAQAGEFLNAKRDGAIGDSHIAAEIGEVIAGSMPGRQNDAQITVYKSLGIIAQDLAAASIVWKAAEARGVGTVIEI
jgi:ornithine cyclodeaminase